MDTNTLLHVGLGLVVGYLLWHQPPCPPPDCGKCANFKAQGNSNERLIRDGRVACKGRC